MTSFSKSTAALIALCLLVSGCAGLTDGLDNLREPHVSLAGLAVKKLNLFKPSFLVRLKVDNPNDVEVNLDGADVALALSGRPVANGVSRSPVSLAKHGTSTLDVEVSADTLGALQQILLLQNQKYLDYQVTGHLNVLNLLGPLGQVPFNFKGAVDREALLREAQSLGNLAVPPGSSGTRSGTMPVR
ncbi:LEA type 2 family protein [Methylomagnum sp.]